MPIVSVATTATLKPGARRSERRAYAIGDHGFMTRLAEGDSPPTGAGAAGFSPRARPGSGVGQAVVAAAVRSRAR